MMIQDNRTQHAAAAAAAADDNSTSNDKRNSIMNRSINKLYKLYKLVAFLINL